MATTSISYSEQQRLLADLMLAVAGESVTVMKKNAPEQALKLKRQDEWKLYLEFLKITFNLADRLSAFHIPIKDQPDFMNGLEDAVTTRLRAVLEPAFSSVDQNEIMMTISGVVAESRKLYEGYLFSITEESKAKNDLFDAFGGRVADALGTADNPQITSAATLCATAMVPAIIAILKGEQPPEAGPAASPSASQTESVASGPPRGQTGNEIKLISVMSDVSGDEIETRWGLHPRFRQDLTTEETQQLTKLMNRVAKVLGERYAAVAFSDEWNSWHKAGHA
ncbi:MAG TPA: hypothetical protein VFV44_07125 [Nitrospiraceae bacterium]|nr:hypothetical protein [Nitrospiraceae bacterium]